MCVLSFCFCRFVEFEPIPYQAAEHIPIVSFELFDKDLLSDDFLCSTSVDLNLFVNDRRVADFPLKNAKGKPAGTLKVCIFYDAPTGPIPRSQAAPHPPPQPAVVAAPAAAVAAPPPNPYPVQPPPPGYPPAPGYPPQQYPPAPYPGPYPPY